MKKVLALLLLTPFLVNAQIYDHKRVFTDSLEYKEFNQGVRDAQVYFKGTRDYFTGFFGVVAYGIPAIIAHSSEPNDIRLNNYLNPNNNSIYNNPNYYSGYRYGAYLKKRKRIREGVGTYLVGIITTAVLINRAYN